MAIAPKEDIEKIKSIVNIVDLVSQYVTLKNAGVGLKKGLCPFHDEKTASFNVKENTGTYICYGCSESGDIFEFIMKILGVDFIESLKILADRANVAINWQKGSLNNDSSTDANNQGVSRTDIININKASLEFFEANFQTDEASLARDELFNRNFTLENCQTFNCGYAPKGWDNLFRYLTSKGFTQKQLSEAGIVSVTQKGNIIDRFRGRLIWPIKDVMGNVIGFGGRKLYQDDTGPKYLNTPETKVYKKIKVLYGLERSRKNIQEARQCVIVEGYTDVMAMHLAGVETAVATCGTAFGIEHVKILNRLMGEEVLTSKLKTSKGRVILTFDGDNAGKKAALKSYDLNNEFTPQTFVISVPEKLDPCDYRKKYGDPRLKILVDNAIPMIEFAINTVLDEFNIETPEGKSSAVKAVQNILVDIKDEIIRDGYISMIANKLNIGKELVKPKIVPASSNLNYPAGQNEYYDLPPESFYDIPEPPEINYPPKDVYNTNTAVTVGNSLNNQINSNKKLSKENACIRDVLALVIQYPQFVDSEQFLDIDLNLFNNNVIKSIYQTIEDLGGVDAGQGFGVKIWAGKIIDILAKQENSEVKKNTVNKLLNYNLPVSNDNEIKNYAAERLTDLKVFSVKSQMDVKNNDLRGLTAGTSEYNQIKEELINLQKTLQKLTQR